MSGPGMTRPAPKPAGSEVGADAVVSPTWWEGYWAHAAGWWLGSGHTPQYEEGWRYREAMTHD